MQVYFFVSNLILFHIIFPRFPILTFHFSGLFTVVEAECLGACVNAPMIQVNDDYYVRPLPLLLPVI